MSNPPPQGIDQADVTTAMQPDPQKKAEAQAGPREQMSKKHNRLLNFVKGLVKGGVHSGIAADRAVSHMGSEKAKYRAGVVRKGPTPRSGPDRFAARYEGKEGFVHVNTSVVTPTLGWGGEGGDLKWAIEIEAISVCVFVAVQWAGVSAEANMCLGDPKDWRVGLEDEDCGVLGD